MLLFGSNGVVAGFIGLSSYEIVYLRTLLGSLLLIGIFLINVGKPSFYRFKKDLICIAVSGAAMGTSWIFLYEAYFRIGVGTASLCYYCGPVIVMILSPLLFGKHLTVKKILCFMAVITGIFMLNKSTCERGEIFGFLCGITSAFMYAVMVISNKKAKNITGLENSTLQLFISFLTVAVFVWLKQGIIIKISLSDILPVLILGIVNTGIGCYLYFSSIGSLPVQSTALLGYVEPLSAVLFSVLFLKERLDLTQIFGCILIITGAASAEISDKM